jgi:hypothetical protein
VTVIVEQREPSPGLVTHATGVADIDAVRVMVYVSGEFEAGLLKFIVFANSPSTPAAGATISWTTHQDEGAVLYVLEAAIM